MNHMKNILLITFGFVLLSILACDLEQEVEIDLPAYQSRLVLECYLEPGQPYYLLLSRSSPYFESFPVLDDRFLENILEDSAEVSIEYGDEKVVLENRLGFNYNTNKLYNYTDSEGGLVPPNHDGPYTLNIRAQNGETIIATTKILPKVPIDSVVVEFNETDTAARVLTYFTDIPNEANFYRRLLHEGSLDSIPNQDFTIDDRVVEDVIVFGTGYDFGEGDTVISSIYHIDEAYYDFLESVEIAISGNFNPFGQPSPINNSLGGTADAIGIFTGLSYDRNAILIER